MLTLHEVLIEVREMRGREDYGICGHLEELGRWTDYEWQNKLDILESLFVKWPEYSGSLTYPVPDTTLFPFTAYLEARPMWTGEYGAARLRLLDYLIEATKDNAD